MSEPPRLSSQLSFKMFEEADLIVLDNQSTSKSKTFKIFDEEDIFPRKTINPTLVKPMNMYETNDECDYETEQEHVLKAHEIMLEDLFESIDYFVGK